jgi:hypothetical protein
MGGRGWFPDEFVFVDNSEKRCRLGSWLCELELMAAGAEEVEVEDDEIL